MFTYPSAMFRTRHKVSFKQSLKDLNKVFLLLDWLLYKERKIPICRNIYPYLKRE